MRARVLYVTDSLMAGGIESQLVELVTRLDCARFEPHILCLYGERTRGLHFAPRIRDAGIALRVLDIGWGARDKLRALGAIAAATRALRPAIVQAEGYHANLLSRVARPFMPSGTKLIGTVRGVETPKQLFYERLSWRLCTRLVASGPHLKQALVARAGVPECRVVVIPNAVDVTRFAPPEAQAPPSGQTSGSSSPASTEASLREQLAPNGDRVFVSLGRISRQKSMHLIAEALGLLKRDGRLPADVRVYIVGQVEHTEMQARLEAAIRQNGLEGVLIQHPATQHPEEYYWAADATILFSTLEGISVAMLESLAAGVPVMLSEEANAAGVIEEGITGWVARTGDTAHLAEVLARVLALPRAQLAAMREASRRRAADYSIGRLIDRYAMLYEELADREGAPNRWRAARPAP